MHYLEIILREGGKREEPGKTSKTQVLNFPVHVLPCESPATSQALLTLTFKVKNKSSICQGDEAVCVVMWKSWRLSSLLLGVSPGTAESLSPGEGPCELLGGGCRARAL